MFTRAEALSTPLRAVALWHLQVRCKRCNREGCVPLQPFVRPGTQEAPLKTLLPRLQCRKCGAKPDYVMLSNARRHGERAGWFSQDTKKGGVQVILVAPR